MKFDEIHSSLKQLNSTLMSLSIDDCEEVEQTIKEIERLESLRNKKLTNSRRDSEEVVEYKLI